MKYNNENKFIFNRKILYKSSTVLLLSILILSLFSFSAFAFSDYEKNVSERLYKDLDEKYRITEFRAGSLEYEILKNLEANVVKEDFKDAEFKVHHIDDKLINAYYIGDGNIMLFDGLLKELRTEDQLAGLIAHEMGHAVEEHLTEDLERNMGLSLLNILFNHFTDNEYQTMTNVAQNLIANGYSREQEQESDIYAVDLMMRTGYNPDGLIDLMKIFKENSHNLKLLEFTQTHPIPESRIEYLEKYIAKKRSENDRAENKADQISDDKIKEENKIIIESEINLKNRFKREELSFSYPENWDLTEQRVYKSGIMFNYQIEAENLSGELTFEDLSSKEFMQTAEKQFSFAAISAEEEGFKVNKEERQERNLNIYKLEKRKDSQHKLSYFIAKNEQQMLRFDFELHNKQEQSLEIIEELIESVEL